MKKIIALLLMSFLYLSSFAQFEIQNATVQQVAVGDTLQTKLSGDSVSFESNKDKFSFNKQMLMKGDSILGQTVVKSLINDSISTNLLDYSTTTEVNSFISDSITDFLTDTEIRSEINDSITTNLSDYSTTTEVRTIVSDSVQFILDSLGYYSTTIEINSFINDSISTNLLDYSTTTEMRSEISDSIAAITPTAPVLIAGYINNSTTDELVLTSTGSNTLPVGFENVGRVDTLWHSVVSGFDSIQNHNEIVIPSAGKYKVSLSATINRPNNSGTFGILLLDASDNVLMSVVSRPSDADRPQSTCSGDMFLDFTKSQVLRIGYFSTGATADVGIYPLPHANGFIIEKTLF
jgi:hypothetical protein